MYRLVEHEVWRQPHEELRRGVEIERRERVTQVNRETRPYMVRDLSWVLARYLDTQDPPASVCATQSGAGGDEGR